MTSANNRVSVLQLTDTHILSSPEATLLGVNTAHYFQAVLALAFANMPSYDLVMLTGDLAQHPVRESYQYLAQAIESQGVPCVCLPGNHDDYTQMQATLNTSLINCVKSSRFGRWLVLALNSQVLGEEGGYLAPAEMRFLQSQLERHPECFVLVALHHHSLPTGSVWMDTMMVANSGDFLDLLRAHPNVKLVINGHIHQEMDRDLGGVRFLGTPSTCFQFKPDSAEFALDKTPPAYRVIHLEEDGGVATEVVRLAEAPAGLVITTHGY